MELKLYLSCIDAFKFPVLIVPFMELKLDNQKRYDDYIRS